MTVTWRTELRMVGYFNLFLIKSFKLKLSTTIEEISVETSELKNILNEKPDTLMNKSQKIIRENFGSIQVLFRYKQE